MSFFCLVTLRKAIEISNRTMKKLKCTPKTVHSSALWAILSVRYECYLKKKERDNCTFLFASLAIVDRLKSGDLKERRLSWGVSEYFSTFGLLLCCLPAGVVPGRSGLLKFPCSSTPSQSEAATPGLHRFLGLNSWWRWVGATGRAETHGHHVSLTAESLSALGPSPSGRSRLEVTTRGAPRPGRYVTARRALKVSMSYQ